MTNADNSFQAVWFSLAVDPNRISILQRNGSLIEIRNRNSKMKIEIDSKLNQIKIEIFGIFIKLTRI